MTTAKELELNSRKATLIVNYGQPNQRALYVVDGSRKDQKSMAIGHARQKYPTETLSWLEHETGRIKEVGLP